MSSGGAAPPDFSLDVSEGDDGQTTVTVAGELDLANADRFASAVDGGLRAGRVFVDLSGLTFMDSAGVRALNDALRAATEHGNELRISAQMDASVVQVLELTGMMGLLTVDGRG